MLSTFSRVELEIEPKELHISSTPSSFKQIALEKSNI